MKHQTQELKSVKKMLNDRRGILGLETVKAVILGLLTLAVVAIAVILALVSLRDSNIFATGTSERNASTNIINNITQGSTNFFSNVPTFFTLLAVVVLILIVAIIIVAVSRFQSGTRGESL